MKYSNRQVERTVRNMLTSNETSILRDGIEKLIAINSNNSLSVENFMKHSFFNDLNNKLDNIITIIKDNKNTSIDKTDSNELRNITDNIIKVNNKNRGGMSAIVRNLVQMRKENTDFFKQAISFMNGNIITNKQNEINKSARIYDEQKEDEEEYRSEKQINLLEKISEFLQPKILSEKTKDTIDFGFNKISTFFKNIFTGKGLLGGLAHWGTAIFGGLRFGEHLAKAGIDLSKLENIPEALNIGFSGLIEDISFGFFKAADTTKFFDKIGNALKDVIKNIIGDEAFNKILEFIKLAEPIYKLLHQNISAISKFLGSKIDSWKSIDDIVLDGLDKNIIAYEDRLKQLKDEQKQFQTTLDNFKKENMFAKTTSFLNTAFPDTRDISLNDIISKLNVGAEGFSTDDLNKIKNFILGVFPQDTTNTFEKKDIAVIAKALVEGKNKFIEDNEKALERSLKEYQQTEIEYKKYLGANVTTKDKMLYYATNIKDLEIKNAKGEVIKKSGEDIAKDLHYCAAGVRTILNKAGLPSTTGNAKDTASFYASNPAYEEVTDKMRESFLKGNIGAGYIVVQDYGDYGHSAITMGGGREVSDRPRNLYINDKTDASNARIFKIADNVKLKSDKMNQTNITDSAINMSIAKQAEMQARNNNNQNMSPIINNFNTSNNINNGNDVDNNTSNGLTQMIALTQKWFMSGIGGM